MKFLSIALATLLAPIDTGRAADYFYETGKGYPYNYEANRYSYHQNVSLKECKELCNKQKGCTTIAFD